VSDVCCPVSFFVNDDAKIAIIFEKKNRSPFFFEIKISTATATKKSGDACDMRAPAFYV
jgi:hypothetical protein